MDQTPRFQLPYILPAQAQKHVTHNEALRGLDAILHIVVLSRTLDTPPANPAEGSCYLVADGGKDKWLGQDGKLAFYQDGAWQFRTPLVGIIAWLQSEELLVVNDGTGWVSPLVEANPETLPKLGVNASADTNNRLAVSSAASLFNHAGNGHQIKVNKNAASDTASLLFQTNWSGRAEMGITGSDDFQFKVSGDGASWKEAITIDSATGAVTLPNTSQIAIGGVRQLSAPGSANVFVGPSGNLSVTGQRNIGLGAASLSGLTSGSNNIAIGYNTGQALTTGSYNVVIGSEISLPPTLSNTIIVGDGQGNERLRMDGNRAEFKTPVKPPSYTVAAVPGAANAGAGAMIYVSDETGGGVPAFSDGTNWRRMTDRTIIS